MMRVLGVNGSPHVFGNTAAGLRAALDELERLGASTAMLNLAELELEPCRGCRTCDRSGSCVLGDDGPELLKAFQDCDALLIGSPVHFGMVTGQLKVAMDRTRPLRTNAFALGGKMGGALSVGASRNGGQELVLQQIHAFMLIHGMTVVGDGPPTAHFGMAGVGAFESDETAQSLAKNLARCLVRAFPKQ